MMLASLSSFALLTIASPLLGNEAVQGEASRFKFYDMPTPRAGPCDLCTGPDGALWGEDQVLNIIFRIDPKTDKVEEYPIPFTLPKNENATLPGNGKFVALSCAIRPGADGNIYASNGTLQS